MKEAFIHLLERKAMRDMRSFVESHSAEEKKKFAPELKAIAKDYIEYRQQNSMFGPSFDRKADDKQVDIIFVACFTCMSRKDFEKSFSNVWSYKKKVLDEVLEWYCPSWFNEYINNLFKGEFPPYDLRYGWLMKQAEKGHLTPSAEAIAATLPYYIFDDPQNRLTEYEPQRLYAYSVTLQEHFWLLFDHPSAINLVPKIDMPGRGRVEVSWIDVISELYKENRIERQRLLKEAILATNKNFNKILSGWFADLLDSLELAAAEVLSLQSELTSILMAPHSRPVKAGLQQLKKIVADPGFDIQAFLDAAPAVLTSETKANISACLTLMEKIAKKNKDHAENIGLLACQVLINTDDTIQHKAAKLILSCHHGQNDRLQQELTAFQPTMLSSARTVLASMLPQESEDHINEVPRQAPAVVDVTDVAIPFINTVDELVFFASQAFDNHRSWHIDILPAALVKLMPALMKEGNADKLEPALQRAIKTANFQTSPGAGLLDQLLALFFIDVCIHLINDRKLVAPALKQQLAGSEGLRERVNWLAPSHAGNHLSRWSIHREDPYLKLWQDFLLEVLNKIRLGETTPLLSTPTHKPAWIDPLVLAKQWAAYQSKNREPGIWDRQIAIARCSQRHSPEAIAFTKENLTGETQRLLLFLQGDTKRPAGELTATVDWLVASLSMKDKGPYEELEKQDAYPKPFSYYATDYEWKVVVEKYEETVYDYQQLKNVKVQKQRRVLRIDFNTGQPAKEIRPKTFWEKLWPVKLKVPGSRPWQPLSIYEAITGTTKRMYLSEEDIRRILLLVPNNMDMLVAKVIHNNLADISIAGEIQKRTVAATLQTIYDAHVELNAMSYLLVGLSLLAPDKTVTALASEIWLRGVSEGSMDSARLGQIMGKLESQEFAPLKRFSDAIEQHMMRVSAMHNRGLQQLLENLIPALPAEAPNNLRKLLEQYNEVLSLNRQAAAPEIIRQKLQTWKKVNSLQKIIQKLNEQ